MSADVFVVIRGAGERTEDAARTLACAEVGAGAVATVREVPFAKALRRSLELGAEAGRRWTLCLDADVLLRSGAIADAVAAAEAAPEAAFCVTARVADKLLCQIRPAGQHLYRTAFLGEALARGAFDPAERRPETALKKAMQAAGHPNVPAEAVLGLHDFEQSFADVFRKAATHVRKHGRFMAEAEAEWRKAAAGDADFRVALMGAALARVIDATDPEPGRHRADGTDRRRFAQDASALLLPAGLDEKPPLRAGEWDGDRVARQLAAFEPALVYRPPEPPPSFADRLRRRGARAPLWLAGAALHRTGVWLRHAAGDAEG